MDPSEGTAAGGGGSGAKKSKPSPAPPIAALGDDILGEIFLRLPDMASLASAALACKPWYRVASVPAVFRRPPLVGFLLSDRGDMPSPYRSPNLRFVRANRKPNLAAAAAGGDFFFENLPAVDSHAEEEGYEWNEWRVRCCDGGRLLLSRGRGGLDLAVYDPITRSTVFLRPYDVVRGRTHVVRYAIVVDEADGSFLVIGFGFGFRAAVYSSRTGKWVHIDMEMVKWRSDTKKHRSSPRDSHHGMASLHCSIPCR